MFRSRNKRFMQHMFKSLVLPHIDYYSQLWTPVDGPNVHSLKKLQSDFFKKILNLRGMGYGEGLIDMKMLSMQRRMDRYRIIYILKMLKKFAPNCGIKVWKKTRSVKSEWKWQVKKIKGASHADYWSQVVQCSSSLG